MITSENVVFEAQFKNFISWRSYTPLFYTLSIPLTSKVTVSWFVLAYKVEYIFKYVFFELYTSWSWNLIN